MHPGVQQHPFFRGVQWDNLYSSTPPYQPTVDHELDTQNFENFAEQVPTGPLSCRLLARLLGTIAERGMLPCRDTVCRVSGKCLAGHQWPQTVFL